MFCPLKFIPRFNNFIKMVKENTPDFSFLLSCHISDVCLGNVIFVRVNPEFTIGTPFFTVDMNRFMAFIGKKENWFFRLEWGNRFC